MDCSVQSMYMKRTYINISNVKLSAKIPDTAISDVENECLANGFECKDYGNFLVFKANLMGECDSFYTFTIFKRRMLKQGEVQPKQHVNITKVLIDRIEEAILTLAWIIKSDSANLSYHIDNITATCSLGRRVDLRKFIDKNSALGKVIVYNPEKFPGCFLTFQRKKAVLFQSGLMNILACKSFDEIEEVYSWISQITAHI